MLSRPASDDGLRYGRQFNLTVVSQRLFARTTLYSGTLAADGHTLSYLSPHSLCVSFENLKYNPKFLATQPLQCVAFCYQPYL